MSYLNLFFENAKNWGKCHQKLGLFGFRLQSGHHRRGLGVREDRVVPARSVQTVQRGKETVRRTQQRLPTIEKNQEKNRKSV